jgi:hypothetical protein
MRPFFLAWLTLALLLLGLGTFTARRGDRAAPGLRAAAPQQAASAGQAIGRNATMVVKQGSGDE